MVGSNLILFANPNTGKTTSFNALNGLSRQCRTPLPRPNWSPDQTRRKPRGLKRAHQYNHPRLLSNSRGHHLSARHHLQQPRQWRRQRIQELSRVALASTWPGGSPIYTLTVLLSTMSFFALRTQCLSDLAVIRKEVGFWRWALLGLRLYDRACPCQHRDDIPTGHGAEPPIIDGQTSIAVATTADSQFPQIESLARS